MAYGGLLSIMTQQNNMDTQDLENRIQRLEQQMRDHMHSGHNDTRINLRDIFGKFEVVSVAPVGKPNDVEGQIKIYTNGATYRLYWYDIVADAWRYATGT